MDQQKLIQTLYNAGFRGEALKKAWAIATRESGGRANALNDNTGTGDLSYGLFQINMLGRLGPARRAQYGLRSNEDLFDPTVNAKVAYQMSKGGTDFGAWGLGPNAYKGAPARAKERYLELIKQYPGSKVSVAQTKQPTNNTFGPSTTQANQVELQDALREQTGEWLMERAAMRRTGQLPSLGTSLFSLGARRRALQLSYEDQSLREAPKAPAAVPDPNNKTFSAPEGSLQLPTKWMGTHVTDRLGWGTKTAEDIMGDPGTAVLSPEDATVVYFHPTGAQGGGSMLLRTPTGREYWLGHIANGLKPGTRVRRGQQIALISGDHPRPHVHLDWRSIR